MVTRSDYELERLENIKRNKLILASLDLDKKLIERDAKKKSNKRKPPRFKVVKACPRHAIVNEVSKQSGKCRNRGSIKCKIAKKFNQRFLKEVPYL
jgi:hypothetical protein